MKYPIYAELRNLCDLALAASLVREEGLADKVDWHMAYFGDPQAFVVEQGAAPKEVDSVVNYRLLNDGRVRGAGQRRRGGEAQRVGQPQGDPGRELSAASGEAAQQRREAAGSRPLVVGLSGLWSAGIYINYRTPNRAKLSWGRAAHFRAGGPLLHLKGLGP